MSDAEFDEYGPAEDDLSALTLPLTGESDLPDDFVRWIDTTLLGSLTASRAPHQRVWCERWAEHPDALHRLLAIWLEWQHVQGGMMSLHDFMRNVLDYHMPYLIGESGALRKCAKGHKLQVRLDEVE